MALSPLRVAQGRAPRPNVEHQRRTVEAKGKTKQGLFGVRWMPLLWGLLNILKDLLLIWLVVIPALGILVVLFLLFVFIIGLPIWMLWYWYLVSVIGL